MEKFEEYVGKLLELARSLQQKNNNPTNTNLNPTSDSMNSNNTSPSEGNQTNSLGGNPAKSNFSNTIETFSKKSQSIQSSEKENRQKPINTQNFLVESEANNVQEKEDSSGINLRNTRGC